MKVCTQCGKSKPVCSFNWRQKTLGRRREQCRSCTRRWSKRHYAKNRRRCADAVHARQKVVQIENRRRVLTYLRSHPCVDCGEPDPIVLEFDHVRGRKVAAVTTLMNRRGVYWPAIEAEIKKCDVRCANDHRRRTVKEVGGIRSLLAAA